MSSMDTTIQEMRAMIDRLESERGGFNFDQLQHEVREWSDRNFGNETPLNSVKNVLGIIEECGELAAEDPSVAVALMVVLGNLSHSHLKELQGIRGTAAEHQAKIKDAVGDIIVYLADYCGSRGFALQDVVESVWTRVKARDWTKDALHGGDVASHRELHPIDAITQPPIITINEDVASKVTHALTEQTHGAVTWELGKDIVDTGEPGLFRVTAEGHRKLARHGLVFDFNHGDVIDMNKVEEQQATEAAREAVGDSDIPF
jgi:NTP pyrophosphatase (non-canonical NTP hydrolase)